MTVANSRTDRRVTLLVVLASAACAFLFSLYQVQNSDFWLHLAAGRWISENGQVPRADPFAFTIEGQAWLYHEWLFGWLQYQGVRLLGTEGLVLVKAVLIAVAVGALALVLRRKKVAPGWILLAVALALAMARFRFLLRPQVIALLSFALFLCILERARHHGWTFLLWLVPIQLVWTNCQGSFILGPLTVLCYGLSALLRGLWSGPEERSRLRRHGLSLLAAALFLGLLALVNPYGYRLVFYPFELISKVTDRFVVREWAAPDRSWEFFFFWSCLALFWVSALSEAIFRSRYRLEVFLLGLGLTLLVRESRRHIEFFSLFFLVHFPQSLEALFGSLGLATPRRRMLHGGFSGLLAGIALAGALWQAKEQPFRFGLGVKPGMFAEGVVHFLADSPLSGRLYNPHPLGGYLSWSLYPRFRVFIDSRLFEYKERQVDREYLHILRARPGWDRVLDKYEINVAVVEYERSVLLAGSRGLGNALYRDPEWTLVYWDDQAMVFTRAGEENAPWVSERQFLAVAPDDFTLKESLSRWTPEEVRAELERALQERPDSSRAHLLMAQLLRKTGRLNEVGPYLEQAVKLKPDEPSPFLLTAEIHLDLQDGERTLAALQEAEHRGAPFEVVARPLARAYWLEDEFEQAARVLERFLADQPGDAEAHGNLALCRVQLGQNEAALKAFERALRIDASNADVLKNRLLLRVKLEQWPEALQDALRLVRLEPSEANRELAERVRSQASGQTAQP